MSFNSEKAHGVRSRILNYAILTEIKLEEIIRDYFINNEDKKTIFEELILSKEFFTFEQKIRIFEKIIGEYTDLKIEVMFEVEYSLKDNKKELMKKIKYIQEVRNAIAHKHPFRIKDTDDISIKYNFGGKAKEIILSESFNKEFFKDYHKVWDILTGLSKKLFGK